MELPLPLQSYQSRSKPLSSQRLLNLFIENSGDPNVKNTMLFGAPGLKHYYDLPGAIRPQLGIISLKGYLVIADQDAVRIVRAEQLGGFSVNTTTWVSLNMTSPTTHVQMVSNGNDILLLNSEAGRLVIATGTNDGDWTIQEPDTAHGYDPNTQVYTSISHIAGVFVATAQVAGAAYVKYGNVLDPNSWGYAFQLDTSLEALTAVTSNMRELWVFAPNYVEILAPSGGAGNYFFSHLTGAYINKGCVFKNSIAVDETSFLFMGSDDAIYASRSYNLAQISTPAIVDMIKSWGTPTDIIGQVYFQGGHRYYVLKFKGIGKTLIYDLTTQSWTERESGVGQEWEGEYFVKIPNGTQFVTSVTQPKLYEMDLDYYTDDGVQISREFVFPTIYGENKRRMLFYDVTIDVDVGLGPNDKILLSWSDDGGYTWSKIRQANLGSRGEYARKIQFRRLGSSIYRTFRVQLRTASRVNILRAYINAEECEE